MALVINTNVASLNAQRNLQNSQNSLQVSLQRLSSGLRINSAKDDAAGLAIAERFTSQINGLDQAGRNANDGISLAQTAEGALEEVTNNLQRVRELAVQAANATNSSSDRAALDAEVQQRLAEVDRIASQTAFNGQNVLDGTMGTATFQVGANAGQTISVNLSQSVKVSAIGQIATTTNAAVGAGGLAAGTTVQIGSNPLVTLGPSVAGTGNRQTIDSAYAKAAAFSSVSGLQVTAQTNIEFGVAATTGTAAGDNYSLRINGIDIFASYDQNANGALTTQQITDAINAQSTNTGVTASLSGANLRLSAADGRNISIAQAFGGAAAGGITAGAGGPTTVNGVTYQDGILSSTIANVSAGASASPTDNAAAVNRGSLSFFASDNVVITGNGTALGFAGANATISRDTTTLSSVNVSSVNGANDAMRRVDAALATVNSLRGTLGAIQNRFDSAIASMQTTSENLSASRSRIQDADFASETASLTRNQVLQQAGVAMLAQANQLPQQVLTLLRG